MAITTTYKYSADLESGAARVLLRQPLSTLDANAHAFVVSIDQAGDAVDLAAARCEGWFIRADGVTVPIDGTTDGNTAEVTLLPACYGVPGRFELAVKLAQGDVIHTVLRVEGSIDVSRTDDLTQGGTAVQSFGKLLDAVNSVAASRRAQNLLDNSNFAQPVNQRGASSYAGAVYGFDRWKGVSDASGVSGGDGYLHFTGEHRQYLTNDLTGKVMTVAAALADGTLLCATGEGQVKANSISLGYDGRWYVSIDTADVKWIALYEGTYTPETLPAYIARGYAAELAECQRYFYRWKSNAGALPAYSYNQAGEIRVMLQLPVPMIATPAVTLDDYADTEFLPGSLKPAAAPVLLQQSGNAVTLGVAVTGAEAGMLYMYKTSGHALELSAEL